MTMLRTFDLKGNKLSFADWISNLSPCETPFVSMIPKEKIDQTQYSWQTDRLAQPNKQGAAPVAVGPAKGGSNPDSPDIAFTGDANFKEGAAFASQNVHYTKVHTNFTQIFRKAVRVSDTTKKVSLYGRGSELTYQMEKAGMEIKRDLEHAILNSTQKGRLGTATSHGAFDGFQNLVAPVAGVCRDTGAVVHKAVTYNWATADKRPMFFTKEQVFDLTYNLYLAGSRANKIMFHPMHMAQFSDWVSATMPSTNGSQANKRPPHMHRMFDGMDTKYNALVKKIRDPLGQEFTLIPNRHMPVNMLFFFNESDWSQMVLREPTKTTLAKMGSSEKQMIEFEVGLRHRNPFASGILKFTEHGKVSVDIQVINPQNLLADNTAEATIRAVVTKADGTAGTTSNTVTVTGTDEDGAQAFLLSSKAPVAATANDEDFTTGTMVLTDKVKIPVANKGKRIKVSAKIATANTASHIGGEDFAVIDGFEHRD
ncbi:MAG: SU10 major capsid protein [Fusobacteriaceae bacterium]